MNWYSLRAKLFVSMGAILLVVAVMTYVIPKLLIEKDLDYAAMYIDKFFDQRSVEEKQKLDVFFTKLRVGLIRDISLVLLSTAILSIGVAFMLLNRISKRITQPIVLLVRAAEKISNGQLENVQMPEVKWQDEVTSLVHAFDKMVISLLEREKIRGVLNKVVSKEIANQLLTSDISLAGEERVVTILFSDIRSFTRISEGLSSKDLIGILNTYMTRMCSVIDATDGVVDKFVGDEIMALYGAPLALKNHAERAIEAALLMIKDLKEYNEMVKSRGEVAFEPGIGIHTGVVCCGNMGAENRLNYTVIGANVNLASRLCNAAKPMQIIVSEETWKEVVSSDRFLFQNLPSLTLKGIESEVAAFEVIGFNARLI